MRHPDGLTKVVILKSASVWSQLPFDTLLYLVQRRLVLCVFSALVSTVHPHTQTSLELRHNVVYTCPPLGASSLSTFRVGCCLIYFCIAQSKKWPNHPKHLIFCTHYLHMYNFKFLISQVDENSKNFATVAFFKGNMARVYVMPVSSEDAFINLVCLLLWRWLFRQCTSKLLHMCIKAPSKRYKI